MDVTNRATGSLCWIAALLLVPIGCSFDFSDRPAKAQDGAPADLGPRAPDADAGVAGEGQVPDSGGELDSVPAADLPIDECTLGRDNCHLHATCEDTVEGFACHCNPGYGGDGVSCRGYDEIILADAPVAYFRFEERSAAIASDSGSHGRDGTLSGGPALDVAGALGDGSSAIRFDGVDDLLTVPHDVALRLDGKFTIEFWAREPGRPHEYAGVLRKGNSASSDGYVIWIGDTGQLAFKRNDHYTTTTKKKPISKTVWRHFALVHDGKTTTWYVDGTLDATEVVSYPASAGTDELLVGTGDEAANIELDELAIYDRPLGATQIALRHAAGQP